jgi:hypothetical protein
MPEIITEDTTIVSPKIGSFIVAAGVQITLPDDCSYTSTLLDDGSTEYVIRESDELESAI